MTRRPEPRPIQRHFTGIGGHTRPNRGQTDSWITPQEIILALGGYSVFALDPCASTPQPWPCAVASYTEADDGLSQPFWGHVWLNPPYGPETGIWLARLAEHGDGIALVFARTETAMFTEYVWRRASALFFLTGRLTFYRPDGTPGDGNSGGPSVLIGYGDWAVRQLRACGLDGALIEDWRK